MDTPTDERTVRRLEQELEETIAGVVARLGLSRLPLLPSQQIMHLMAKAAAAVYESAVENQDHSGRNDRVAGTVGSERQRPAGQCRDENSTTTC